MNRWKTLKILFYRYSTNNRWFSFENIFFERICDFLVSSTNLRDLYNTKIWRWLFIFNYLNNLTLERLNLLIVRYLLLASGNNHVDSFLVFICLILQLIGQFSQFRNLLLHLLDKLLLVIIGRNRSILNSRSWLGLWFRFGLWLWLGFWSGFSWLFGLLFGRGLCFNDFYFRRLHASNCVILGRNSIFLGVESWLHFVLIKRTKLIFLLGSTFTCQNFFEIHDLPLKQINSLMLNNLILLWRLALIINFRFLYRLIIMQNLPCH